MPGFNMDAADPIEDLMAIDELRFTFESSSSLVPACPPRTMKTSHSVNVPGIECAQPCSTLFSVTLKQGFAAMRTDA